MRVSGKTMVLPRPISLSVKTIRLSADSLIVSANTIRPLADTIRSTTSCKRVVIDKNEQKKRGNFEKISFWELLNDFFLLLNKRNGGFFRGK